MGKTYSIRKVDGGGGVKWNSGEKKTSVGLSSTFRHPLGSKSTLEVSTTRRLVDSMRFNVVGVLGRHMLAKLLTGPASSTNHQLTVICILFCTINFREHYLVLLQFDIFGQ